MRNEKSDLTEKEMDDNEQLIARAKTSSERMRKIEKEHLKRKDGVEFIIDEPYKDNLRVVGKGISYPDGFRKAEYGVVRPVRWWLKPRNKLIINIMIIIVIILATALLLFFAL